MANLTADLPLANSSRRIIDPGSDGPSWLQGLASGAAKAVNTISGVMGENEANARRTRAEEAAAREAAAQEAAADFTLAHARGAFNDPAPGPVPNMEPISTAFDSELEGAPPPADVINSVDEAVRARAAESQGRAPSGSGRIIMERALSRLLAEHPDNTQAILKEFRENGFDHILMRERDTEIAWFEAERSGQIKMQQDYANAAVAGGLVLPGTPMADAARVGQIHADQERILERGRQDAAAAAAAAAEGRTQETYDRTRLDREVTSNMMAGLSAALNGPFNGLKNLFSQSNGDQSVLNLLPDTLNAFDQIVNNYVTAAQQRDAPPETVAAMRATGAALRSQVVDLVSGPGSELGVANAVLDGMQARLGINMMQALPIMSAMKEMFGMAGLEQAFGVNPARALPEAIITSMRREIEGVQGAIDTNSERVTMATLAQMLKGQLQITDMSEEQATTALPPMVLAVRGLAPAIRQGGGNTEHYINSNLQVARAAMEIQPGRGNAQTEGTIIGNVMSNDVRAADLALMARDPEAAGILIEAKRATAQHLLLNINNADSRGNAADTNDGLWTVQYGNGRYQTVITEASYRTFLQTRYRDRSNALVTFNGGGRVPTMEELRRQGPPRGLRDRIGGINLAVDYLVATNQYDDNFRGVSAPEARDFFITGAVPSAMRARSEQQQTQRAPLAGQIESYRTMVDEARVGSEQLAANEIQGRAAENTPLPRTEVQRKVRAAAEAVGVSWDVVNRLVNKESQWDLNADSGSSQGLFQVNGGTAQDLDGHIQEGLDHWLEAGRTAQSALGRAPTPGDQYVAYQQGVGGGAALLNPANASTPAWQALLPSYRRQYGDRAESVAKRAVTGNGGNLNMTAAQFAQHIRDYFNR